MKFLNKLKHLLNKIFNNKTKLKNILDDVNEGDIIWVKRYKNRKIKKTIPDGHKEGPMIVLKKRDNKLICSYGTSVYHDGYYEINSIEYNLSKKTFFRLKDLSIVDNKMFIKKLSALREQDMNNILKQLKINKGNYYEIDGEFHKIPVPFECGDIIKKDQHYIIIDIVDSNFVCVPIKKIVADLKRKLNFNDFRYLDYSKIVSIKKSQDIKFINRVSSDIFLFILKKQNEYIKNIENKKTVQRGSVIIKDKKFYYIYGEEGQEWFVFEINKLKSEEFKKVIIINNQLFYTNYQETKINKKEEYNPFLLASDSEIDSIKENRKSYNRNKKNNYDVCTIGDIIEPISSKDKRYIVIAVCKKTYECLSINKLKNGVYDPILLKKTNVKLSQNKSIEGIVWLEQHPKHQNLKKINAFIIDKILETQRGVLKAQKLEDNSEIIQLKNSKNIIINGEEYIIKKRIGDIIACISIYDKGNPKRQIKYFNINDIKNMEEENIKKL